MFEDIFWRKKPNDKKLRDYGFSENKRGYCYDTCILDGGFTLHISIDQTGKAETALIETENGEEYVLYKTKAQGAFVGDVRTEIEKILKDIAEKCYETSIFQEEQTLLLIQYFCEKYGDEPEFLWDKFPHNAILRRKDSQKWYAAILTVQKKKLGIPSDEMAEIIDLRCAPELLEKRIDHQRYYPGWHMNKKHWYTILLDGSVVFEEICRRVDESYVLAK